MGLKRVILCPNPYRDKGLAAAKEANSILRSVGLETVYCLPFKPEGGDGQFGVHCRPLHQEIRSSDLIIAFGGDGTILHLARTASMRRCWSASWTTRGRADFPCWTCPIPLSGGRRAILSTWATCGRGRVRRKPLIYRRWWSSPTRR